jgi:hypothetical protein
MDDAPILICYDGSPAAERAIETAAELLGARRAVVLDIAPPITVSESLATFSPVVPGGAFEEFNEAEAERVAGRGAELARSSGFDAEGRGALAGRVRNRDRLARPKWPARDRQGKPLA